MLAHSGEFLLVAEPTTVAPGGTVTVRADLPTTGPLRLFLAGSGGSVREVGVVEQTDEGHFEIFVQIPVDLPLGPLPSGWRASRSGSPAATPAAADGRPAAIDLVPFAALGAAILAVGILVVRTRLDRSSGGPSDPPR